MTSKKEIAKSFLYQVANGEVQDAYNNYIGDIFKHHNAFFPGDRQSLKNAMQEDADRNPNKILTIKLSLEDGDLVMIYSHIQQNLEDLGTASAHIFKFENNKIVELWGVDQEIPADITNENGIY